MKLRICDSKNRPNHATRNTKLQNHTRWSSLHSRRVGRYRSVISNYRDVIFLSKTLFSFRSIRVRIRNSLRFTVTRSYDSYIPKRVPIRRIFQKPGNTPVLGFWITWSVRCRASGITYTDELLVRVHFPTCKRAIDTRWTISHFSRNKF